MLGVAEQAAVSPSPLFPMTAVGVDDRFLTGLRGFPEMSGVALTKSQIFQSPTVGMAGSTPSFVLLGGAGPAVLTC